MSNFTTTYPAIATKSAYCEASPLTQSDRTTIARVLSWDMCAEVQADEVITIAITNGIVQVKLTSGRAALLSVDTFKSILKQQRQQVNEDVVYIQQLEQKLEKDSNEIKIARASKIYLLGGEILTTFYPAGRSWNNQAAKDKFFSGSKTANAQNQEEQRSNFDLEAEVAA